MNKAPTHAQISRTPFTTYDIIGYLAPGFLFTKFLIILMLTNNFSNLTRLEKYMGGN